VDGELLAQRNNLQLKREPPAERGDEEVMEWSAPLPEPASKRHTGD
jgi:hypothetical protein